MESPMEIHKHDLKHEDPTQDITWEDDDLILDLKEEMIRLLDARPAQIILTTTEIVIFKTHTH
jgi:hypothetical protein